MKSIILTIFLIASAYSYGQQLVYTPINPAFGGSEFNYAWMLSSAESQNKFKDDEGFGLDGLDFDFLEGESLFGENLLGQNLNGLPTTQGTSSNGNLEYEVIEGLDGLIINILNAATGEQSQIIIPN
ncbi:MAG: curli assembly protein CsgF [Flavobacteriaceae bacterium]|jgi:curli production assembly/transport component CsgF|nr:curli assembly protein CsgF [Flavobacteriaceae bacterium]|tara:strand:- start:2992 stop:3372 length:381 start_codon:yes stop_codon:yes gene_type:complete